jgi:hypothetical protein
MYKKKEKGEREKEKVECGLDPGRNTRIKS